MKPIYLCLLFFFSCREKTITRTPITPLTFVSDSVSDTLTITAVGDIMLGSAYPSKSNLPKNPPNSFKNAQQFLKGDIVFGNLEGCLLDSGKSTKCKDAKSTSCYAFRMPEGYVKILKNAGFNLLSIANNHIGDFGSKGRNKTVELLKKDSINFAGLLSYPISIFQKNNIKYGFCAFSPNNFTVSINNLDSARNLIKALKKQVDIVIVSFHGGGEGLRFEHVLKTNEIFYKENRGNVYLFAHTVIDAGADIVLGHGPHVTRAVEVYKNRFIAYSLGNFCTYGQFNLDGSNGFAPLINVKLNSKGEFLFADVVSVKQGVKTGLEIDTMGTAFKKMEYLTNTDFMGNQLTFINGRIATKKP